MSEHQVHVEPPRQPERREDLRCNPEGQVEVTCRPGVSGLGPDIALALLDVSAGGARLMVKSALSVGQVVEVCLYPAVPAPGLRRAARVVWSTEARGGYYFVGVRFEAPLDPESTRTLRLCRAGRS